MRGGKQQAAGSSQQAASSSQQAAGSKQAARQETKTDSIAKHINVA
jgi:hypothetical protein